MRAQLDALAAEYATRGIEMKETGERLSRPGARASSRAEISRLWPERPPRFSRALLETLALIAYRQPITRAEIEAVRGVAVNPNIVKTLLERNWVRVVGQRDVPGHPELLGTTREFLDYFGLKSLDELPPLAELTAMARRQSAARSGRARRRAQARSRMQADERRRAAVLDEDERRGRRRAVAEGGAARANSSPRGPRRLD